MIPSIPHFDGLIEAILNLHVTSSVIPRLSSSKNCFNAAEEPVSIAAVVRKTQITLLSAFVRTEHLAETGPCNVQPN